MFGRTKKTYCAQFLSKVLDGGSHMINRIIIFNMMLSAGRLFLEDSH